MTSEYQLNIEKRPLYVYACVQGNSTDRSLVRQYLTEILEIFRTAQYSRLLVKKEIPAGLDEEDLKFVTDEILRQGAQGLKIAIVDESSGTADEMNRSADNTRNAGVELAFFDSFAAAVHWLLHG